MSAFNTLIEQGFPVDSVRRIVTDTLACHGDEPCSRSQAAAHEAGHWIIGDTMGLCPYRLLRVFRRHGQWLGENLPMDNSTAHAIDEPKRYRCHTLQVIGGFVGELAAGHCHPSSSLDERTLFQSMCHTIAHFEGCHTVALHMAAFWVAAEIIESRREDFNRVRHHLERERRILRPQLDRMSRPDPEPWLRRWNDLAANMPTEVIGDMLEMLP